MQMNLPMGTEMLRVHFVPACARLVQYAGSPDFIS
jgi:hypothetical protein